MGGSPADTGPEDSRALKICIITSSFPLNRDDARAAAGLFVRDFAVELADLGHRVTVVTPDKAGEGKDDIPGVTVHWYPWRGGKKVLSNLKLHRPGDLLEMISLFRNGGRYLDGLTRTEGFDHVLAMWAVPAGWLARGLKRRHGIPYTTWCLGADIWVYGRIPLLRSLVRRVLVDSDLLYADGLQLSKETARLAGRPCPFLPSSRRLDRSLAEPLDLPGSGFRFLFVGRYHPAKGVDVLLAAMRLYLTQGNTGHFHLFGGGPLEDLVRREASSPELRAHVSEGGFADHKTVVSHLEACDCLVIPSRIESIPVVLSDAIQTGTPVIVSDVGDMGDLIREHPAGLIVPPEDPAALVEAMKKMSATGRHSFREHTTALAKRFSLRGAAKTWTSRAHR